MDDQNHIKYNQDKNSDYSNFSLDNNKSEFKSIKIPTISLPKGGGAIKGIDEKFTVNPVNGTASLAIPLPFSPARNITPSLSLSYNSGRGNGIFGLGWGLDITSVSRKTSAGIPRYLDAEDSDTFVLSDAEDLVPEFRKAADGSFITDTDGNYVINETTSAEGDFTIRTYRPRIEGLFARIERWQNKNTGEMKWRVISMENITTLYGWTDLARISAPGDARKTFKWLPELVIDDKGNCAHYIYKKEDSAGIDPGQLHNRNRLKEDQPIFTNTYLSKVLYGNKTPYKAMSDDFPLDADFLFSTVFDYGEYDSENPENPLQDWDFRPDAFSSFRSGFEIRTARLCKRILLFHHFTGAGEYEGLVKSLNLEYTISSEADITYLSETVSSGYIKKADGTYSRKSYPPLTFTYQDHAWNSEVKYIDSDDLIHAPAGLESPVYKFTDLYNEGLSGILTEQSGNWYYKSNLGNGTFAPASLVNPRPSFKGMDSAMVLMDLDADGSKQFVSMQPAYPGFFEQEASAEWKTFKAFRQMPNIDFGDPEIRMLDLTGDGRADIVLTEDNVISWYPSEGRTGFAPQQKTQKELEEEAGPTLVFSDMLQSIFLADMSGDGLTDLVRIRNAEICYWPNMGYGNFGSKITMDDVPEFDHPDMFQPAYIRLADIDGSGTADIIYLGKNTISCWKNLCGNALSSTPHSIEFGGEIHNRARITVADILGNGIACIVWSSALQKDSGSPLRYIDLLNGLKPHILSGYSNNMGKEVMLEYAPSTKFYLDDRIAGKPWASHLHFPVHCISRTITRDVISGVRYAREYTYHHGYYDHYEREFRGFGMVERKDAEFFEHWVKTDPAEISDTELQQEPVITRTWNHTGAFLDREHILDQFREDYWFKEMERQGFTTDHNEPALQDARIVPGPGLDPSLTDELNGEIWQEAIRACKGMTIRKEVFTQDADKFGDTVEARQRALTPYTVSMQNCIIELLQPKGSNAHAVFVVKNSESFTFHYERSQTDPRIAHSLNIRMDEYGNILESAAVVYPRKTADPALPEETRKAQSNYVIIYKENHFTNDVITEDAYRLRLPSETKTYQLRGVPKSGAYYSVEDFDDILSDTNSDTAAYHELESPLTPGRAQKRCIENVRSVYYNNDLTAALPLHTLESLAVSFESYQLAYTPDLLSDIFALKVTPEVLEEGNFTHFESDTDWWAASGRAHYLLDGDAANNARLRFYAPVAYEDPSGSITRVSYYGNYFMNLEQTEDAQGNTTTVDSYNFRTLSPITVRDINNNISEALLDELGLVKAVAIKGKGAEADELTGLTEVTDPAEDALVSTFFASANSQALTVSGKDLLKGATTRFLYDLQLDIPSGKPAATAQIDREVHFHIDNDSPIQMAFDYSDGHGNVVVRKVQAEPGIARQVVVNPDLSISVNEIDTTPSLRWIGNGRVIKNNKGNAVKEYEPYFSVTHKYENFRELVESGVTPLMYYDPMGRLVKTRMPDGTLSKVFFDAWNQRIYDSNDMVQDPECTWFKDRSNHLIDDELTDENKDPSREKQAADQTLVHADTPDILHLDVLGRPVFSIQHSKNSETDADEFFHTIMHLDAEGNVRTVTDARNNQAMACKFDMLGNQVYQNSMDGGQRWIFNNVLNVPVRTWDERNHEFQYRYDPLNRLKTSKIIDGDGPGPLDHVFGNIIYGEDLLLPDGSNKNELQLSNLLGQAVKQFDTGGLIETPAFDFKGNALSQERTLFRKYKEVPDWIESNQESDLETETFAYTSEYDALGRITRQVHPDGSVITPVYNQAGLMTSEAVLHSGAADPVEYIKEIRYNEHGNRERIRYGNDVITKYQYDKATFRLIHLKSRLGNHDLQDLYYTYDPVGNVTHIEDKAIPVEFFNNQKISGTSEFTYNPIYQLTRATGRENNGALTFGNSDNWNDQGFMHALNPGDPMAIRNYNQRYTYDEVGNLLQIRHNTNGNSWVRNLVYGANNNRLLSTHIAGSHDYTTYQYHAAHGFMTTLPHLEEIGWNFKEELVRSIRQKVSPGNGSPETTYYQYDGQGQRIRKITENAAPAGGTPSKKEERIYLANFERYRKLSGANAGLTTDSLSLMDNERRFVLIETRNDVNDGTVKQLVRYQLHNHLGSSALELNSTGDVISYEEYHPYGTTAYQARNASINSAAKRYRFSGRERDEESGLEYHTARYYIPWLGRWLSCDPSGVKDSINRYQYARGNPVTMNDPGGLCSCNTNEKDKEKKKKEEEEEENSAQQEEQQEESDGILDKIKNAISSFFGVIGQAIIAAGRWIAETATKVWDFIKGAATAAWNWIKQAAVDAWNWIRGALETAWDWAKNAVSSAWNWIKEAAGDAWEWIKEAAVDAWVWIKQAAEDIWNWALAPLIRTATNTLVGALPGLLTGNLTAAIAGGIAGGVTGAVHGWAMAYAHSYDWSSETGWLQFLADNTWSLPNSVVGSLFATANIFWNPINKGLSNNTGQLYFRKQWFPPYDTTLPGNVTVGKVVPVHERVHTDQARYFGPIYLAFQLVWYGFWLAMFPIGIPASFITGKNYLKCIAYNKNPFEVWAYHVEGSTSC